MRRVLEDAPWRSHFVLDCLEALKATDDILSDNGVRQQASEDIAPI